MALYRRTRALAHLRHSYKLLGESYPNRMANRQIYERDMYYTRRRAERQQESKTKANKYSAHKYAFERIRL